MIDQPFTTTQVVPKADCAVLVLDENGAVVSSNATAQQLLGLSGEELTGQYCAVNPSVASQPDEIAGALATIGSPLGVLTLANSAGKNVVVKGTCVPLDASAVGRLLTLVVLDQEFQPTAGIDNLRNETLTTISHEMRTPLCTIVGYLDLLSARQRNIGRSELARIVRVLRRSSKWLEQSTDNLIYMLHILAGHFGVHPSPMHLADLLTESVGMVEVLAASKQQSIRVVFPETHATVWADRPRVLLVIANLLSNAIRHAPQAGHVTLSAVPTGSDWQISVSDSGQDRPWWEQARPELDEDGQTRPDAMAGATGHLGIAVARYVVEQHGGTMGLTSGADAGSTSWFTLPGAPAAMAESFSENELRSA